MTSTSSSTLRATSDAAASAAPRAGAPDAQAVANYLARKPDLPHVSTIIPAYNAARFVHNAIESAMAQTHRPLEIIVVDDGSTDYTADVAARYPVQLLRQNNAGPGGARNTGVRAAQGEWMAFLDHDDTWHPEKTSRQLAIVDDGVAAVFSAKFADKSQFDFEELFWRNLGGNPSSTLIRKDALLRIGLFDADRGLMGLDDYHMWLKFLWAGLRFKTTQGLYNFTPSEQHYGGKLDKMLSAELLNIEKISHMTGMAPAKAAARMRLLRLDYIPSLIYGRQLAQARAELRALGMDRDAMPYWYAFLPQSLINAKRSLRRLFAPPSKRP